jgi:hypothetical protein
MPVEKEWTVMVILAGDNNLSEEMLFSLREMKLAGANPQVNVIALFDPNEPGMPTQRFALNSLAESPPGGMLIDELNSDIEGFPPVSGEFNAGNPQDIADFIRQGIKLFPARHYMVVLSGHGPGDVDTGFLLTDDNPQDSLDLAELKSVFVLAKKGLVAGEPGVKDKIDILGMDSCLMSAAEVAYQLREHVDFVVGPQGFEPNMGWPYREALGVLLSNPQIAAGDLAVKIVDEYIRYYYDYTLAGRSVDLSACNLQNTAALVAAVKGLVEALLQAMPAQLSDEPTHPDVRNAVLNAIILAHWEAQGFKFDQFIDLYDFCDRLEQRCNMTDTVSGAIRDACVEVKRVVGGADPSARFVMKSCTSGPSFQHSHGLSIFLPWALPAPVAYTGLDFPQATEWHLFIERYVENSRRSPRPGVRQSPIFPLILDSPTKSRGTDKPGTMKNSPLTWKLSQCLVDLIDSAAAPGGDAGGSVSTNEKPEQPPTQ